jgi:hypothetical protein
MSIAGYLTRVIAPCIAVVALSAGAGCAPYLIMTGGRIRLIAVLLLFWSVFAVLALYLCFDRDERRTLVGVVRSGAVRTGARL